MQVWYASFALSKVARLSVRDIVCWFGSGNQTTTKGFGLGFQMPAVSCS
jgi:hypothetical protein